MFKEIRILSKGFNFFVICTSKNKLFRNELSDNKFKKFEYLFLIRIVLETRDSNPYYLDPKSSALPIKLVSRWVLLGTSLGQNEYKQF